MANCSGDACIYRQVRRTEKQGGITHISVHNTDMNSFVVCPHVCLLLLKEKKNVHLKACALSDPRMASIKILRWWADVPTPSPPTLQQTSQRSRHKGKPHSEKRPIGELAKQKTIHSASCILHSQHTDCYSKVKSVGESHKISDTPPPARQMAS